MQLIDTHSHLYLENFDDDRDEVMTRALKEGVEQILLPNIDRKSILQMESLHNEYPQHTKMMMGLHPCDVKADWQNELDFITDSYAVGKHIAIGEIGIDLYWDKTFFEQQVIAFETQIALAIENSIPFVIHARDSFPEIFTSLKRFDAKKLIGVFHSFTGGIEELSLIKELGNFKLGINGIVTFKNSGLDKAIANASIDDLVLETDAPFLSPVPYRGKRNESSYLSLINTKIASIFELSEVESAERTSKNAKELFNL